MKGKGGEGWKEKGREGREEWEEIPPPTFE